MADTTILHPSDAAILLKQGLVDKISSEGSQRLHKRRLNSSSENEYRHVPLNVPLNSPAAEDIFASIPASLVSYETLRWVGLTESKATELWSKWSNWPSHGIQREVDPEDGGLVVYFDEFIVGHTCIEANNAAYDDDDMAWQTCLEAYGLDSDFIQGIMEPRFRELRLAESAFFWAKDTIEVRYRGLREIQAASRQRAMALQRLAGRNPDSQSSTAQTGRRSISGAQQDANPGVSVHSWTSASAIARRNTPGVLTLYKALDQA